MTGVRVSVSSEYPTAALLTPAVTVDRIEAGATADVRPHVRCRFTSGAGDFSRVRFDVKLTYDGWHEAADVFDVLVIPDVLPAPAALEILDGRTVTFHVFRQKGNQGGGAAFQRTVTEGKGNANGILEPGEEATIWVKLAQGMDPFDKNTWHRAKVYGDSPWLAEVEDLEEQKGLEWTGAKERTSVVRLSPDTPPGSAIPLVLSNESWSYHFTPDVRYGREPLYQAFQLHTRHLHGLTLRTPQQ
jgi:hypothetical protein